MCADVATCVEVDGFNSLLVRSPSEASSMEFNWVAGPATTQAEFFKGGHGPVAMLSYVHRRETCDM
jgi:hypothetical protein